MGKGRDGRHWLAALSVVLLMALTSLAILLAANSLLRSRVTDGTASPAPALTGPTVTFGALGDFDGNAPNYPIAVTEMKRLANRNADFLLAVGDLGYNSDEQTWCQVIKANLNETIIVAGNHDTTQSGPGDINNAVLYCPFNLGVPLVAGPTYGYGISYYFDYPATNPLVRVIMITAGVSSTQTSGENYGSGGAEYTWTVNAATSARAAGIPWVVVGVHKVCINAGSYGCEIGQALWDALITAKVDLLLTGHYHVYERSYQLAHSATCTSVRDGSYNAACVADFDSDMVKGAGIVQVTDGAGGESVYSIDTSSDGQYFPVYMGSNMNSQGKTQGWGAALMSLNATTLVGSTMFCPPGTTDSSGECPTAASTTFQDSFTIGSGAAPPPPPPSNAAPTLSRSYATPSPATTTVPVDVGTIYTDADNDAPMLIRVVVLNSTGRDPSLQPFTSNSIWNLPIGASAVYVAGGITPATASGMTTDPDIIVLSPNAPMTDVYENNDGWGGGSRCAAQGPVLTTVPIPTDFVVPGASSSDMPNNAAAFLLPDGHTLVQGQPFTRCTAGGTATIMWIRDNDPTSDLYDLGFYGAHGGSMLSSIGGTIRLGELVPGGVIRHALKLQLYGAENYYYDQATQGYRWPALTADGYASSTYGGMNPALRMGSLLALPASLNIDSLNLQTEPARILARALQDYGGYVADDTYWDVYAIGTEFSPAGRVEDEFQTTWSYAMDRSSLSSSWSQDMSKIFQALAVVDNWNAALYAAVAASGGAQGAGGGAPRQAWAPGFGVTTTFNVTLTANSTSDTNYRDGKAYHYTFPAGTFCPGNYSYYFLASDGTHVTTTPTATLSVGGTGCGVPPPPPLSANFTFTPTSPVTGQTVTFVATASGGTSPYSYSWAFGDGATGTGATATHAYASAGTFTARLTLTDAAASTATASKSIVVSAAPPPLTAGFSYSPSNPVVGQSVTFTGSASGGTSPYTYAWVFGDGATGSGATASHNYASAATFTATLTVTDAATHTATASKSVVVGAAPSPLTAAFTFSPSSPVAGQSVTFTGSASGGTSPYTYAWAFGDGATGSGATTSHAYASAGTFTATLTVTDAVTQTAATSKSVVVSAAPPPGTNPTASFTFSPTWPRVNAAVNFDASGSSSANGTLEVRWDWTNDGTFDTGLSTTRTSTHTYTAAGTITARLQVRDSWGRMDNTTRSVPVDGGLPSTSASVSGTLGSAGWYRSGVTVTLTTTDDLSGVASTWIRTDNGSWVQGSGATFTSDGLHSLDYYSVDRAGNTEGTHTILVPVDTTPPTTTVSLQGATDVNGSYVDSVDVTLAATDATSGIASTTYRVDGGGWQTYVSTFTVTGVGSHLIEFNSTDVAGNLESTSSTSPTIASSSPPSTQAPSTTVVLSGTMGPDSWYISTVTVTLSATSPSALAVTIAYRLDGGAWQTYASPFVVGEGRHTLDYNATDSASNGEATHSSSFRVDTTLPVTVANLTGTHGRDHWFTSAVIVTLAATDAVSGVASTMYRLDGGAWQAYASSFIVGNGRHVLEYRSTDLAGLAESVTPTGIKVDTTPPHVTVSAFGATLTSSQATFTWTGTDDLAGVFDNGVSVDGGAYLSVGLNGTATLSLADGTHAIRVRVLDAAGNAGVAEVTVRVDTNLFSPTGPYQGVPLYLLLEAALAILAVSAVRRHRRVKRAHRVQALRRMAVRAR